MPPAPSTPKSPSRKRTRSFPSKTPSSNAAVKKIKLQATYTSESPFPNHPHPTADEAVEVHDILTKTHRPIGRRPPQYTSHSTQTCGNVPNVIESIISTILSQHTSNSNSTRAKANLDQTFGRNNFEAIASAPREKVIDAIRTGGLANKKAGMIQGLLHAIKEKHGSYSLQHLTSGKGTTTPTTTTPTTNSTPPLTNDEIMTELLSYNGVGPKTASCVLLFCLGRDSFAVDTHVYRLTRLLGWIPVKANRVTAQAHLDLWVSGGIEVYGLHVLMVQHGRECRGCKRDGSGEDCVLKMYLKERGKVRDGDFGFEIRRSGTGN